METEYKTKLRERYNLSKKQWVAMVGNIAKNDNGDIVNITTEFNSGQHDIENILHKVELDLYTNLKFGFKLPIIISIKGVEK